MEIYTTGIGILQKVVLLPTVWMRRGCDVMSLWTALYTITHQSELQQRQTLVHCRDVSFGKIRGN